MLNELMQIQEAAVLKERALTRIFGIVASMVKQSTLFARAEQRS